MEKQIFNKGERVYVAGYGWGTVSTDRHNHFVLIDFDNFKNLCGVDVNRNFVSYTEYSLQNFSQERQPIDCNDYIDKWGKFWNQEEEGFSIGKLKRYHFLNKNHFFFSGRFYYDYFEPLTEEQIEMLELE